MKRGFANFFQRLSKTKRSVRGRKSLREEREIGVVMSSSGGALALESHSGGFRAFCR